MECVGVVGGCCWIPVEDLDSTGSATFSTGKTAEMESCPKLLETTSGPGFWTVSPLSAPKTAMVSSTGCCCCFAGDGICLGPDFRLSSLSLTDDLEVFPCVVASASPAAIGVNPEAVISKPPGTVFLRGDGAVSVTTLSCLGTSART